MSWSPIPPTVRLAVTAAAVTADTPSAPYRDPPPDCAACAARAANLAKLLPFEETRLCVLCGQECHSVYQGGCRGGERLTIQAESKGTWWFWFWRRGAHPSVVRLCPVAHPDADAITNHNRVGILGKKVATPEEPLPLHFHYLCKACGHMHSMRARRPDDVP